MRYRKLGKTGILVSEIGFGTWGIGGVTDGATSYGETNDIESTASLLKARDLGITFYDTANIYGNGHSEELLGETFSGSRDGVVIATKVGFTKHGGPHDVSVPYVKKCLEDSLRRLKSDYVDLYQLHSVPPDLVRSSPEILDFMKTLKQEGKIRAFGYSVKSPQEARIAIEEFGADVVQVNFNMVDQRAITSGVFDVVRSSGAGFIARTPLCFGFLTGAIQDIQFSSQDHRSSWSQAQLERWKTAPDVFSFIDPEKKYTPAQLALKFCLSFDGVSTAIPGMLSVREVQENSQVSNLPELTDKQLKEIEEVCSQTKFFLEKS